MALKILVVDDEQLIIDVLQAYLEKEGYEVYSATNGVEALKKINEKQPDFLILDLMLPDISGEEICRQVRHDSDIPILMLTAKAAEEERIQGIVSGADDYVTKPFSPREVVVRVQAILRRVGKHVQQDSLSFNNGELIINVSRHEVSVRGQQAELTPIEFKLLAGMARSPGRVYSRLDLLEKVQDDYYEGYERSIDVHVKNLRKKIEQDTKNPTYVLTVFGVGYKFGGKADASYTPR